MYLWVGEEGGEGGERRVERRGERMVERRGVRGAWSGGARGRGIECILYGYS